MYTYQTTDTHHAYIRMPMHAYTLAHTQTHTHTHTHPHFCAHAAFSRGRRRAGGALHTRHARQLWCGTSVEQKTSLIGQRMHL